MLAGKYDDLGADGGSGGAMFVGSTWGKSLLHDGVAAGVIGIDCAPFIAAMSTCISFISCFSSLYSCLSTKITFDSCPWMSV